MHDGFKRFHPLTLTLTTGLKMHQDADSLYRLPLIYPDREPV